MIFANFNHALNEIPPYLCYDILRKGDFLMATINSILADIATLSKADIDTLKNHFAKMFLKSATTLEEMVIDNRFSGGMACPVCGCIHIVRNGHRKDGTQRYVCRDCGKSFVATTNTIAMYTKKDVETWETYIDCMINGFALRKTADICDISLNTAFYWRHKILGALQNMADSVILNGIIEADETFFPVSYKGGIMEAYAPKSVDDLKEGLLGIKAPDKEQSRLVLPQEIDLVLVPCVAFDEEKRRLGHGGGYYDRYLPECTNAKFVLIAFEAQKILQIATEKHDILMDLLVTEQKVY